MIEDYQAKVVENKQLTKFIFETCLELERPMEWETGQYVSIQTSAPRSYSICSLPSDSTHVSICVDVKPDGVGSRFIKNLRIGDTVNFKGPLGKFLITNYQLPNYVFVATGTGIGPFKAMIPALLNDSGVAQNDVRLFWGLRHKSENYYVDFWENLSKKFSNFKFQIVNSEDGHHVTEFVEGQKETQYYLCGNMNMIRDVSEKLEGKGVARENIHFESYF